MLFPVQISMPDVADCSKIPYLTRSPIEKVHLDDLDVLDT